MKKYFVLALISLLLFSCSEDDQAAVDNPTSSQLIKSVQKMYNSQVLEGKLETTFINSKPAYADFYSAQNVLLNHSVYNYNNNGMLGSIITYSPTDIELRKSEYNYDTQGRLNLFYKEEGSYNSTATFTFNSDNTITSSTISSDNNSPQIKTFYLNDAGIVYKEISGSNTYELTFDGLNPVTAQSNSGFTKTFVYDNINLPQSPGAQIFGLYKPNAVLRANYLADAETSTATKYLLKEISESEVRERIYTFNSVGKPSQALTYRNDVLISETEYIYE